jgi:hypothetical protein
MAWIYFVGVEIFFNLIHVLSRVLYRKQWIYKWKKKKEGNFNFLVFLVFLAIYLKAGVIRKCHSLFYLFIESPSHTLSLCTDFTGKEDFISFFLKWIPSKHFPSNSIPQKLFALFSTQRIYSYLSHAHILQIGLCYIIISLLSFLFRP